MSLAQDNVVRVLGTEGRIEVADFWFASGHAGGTGRIEVIRRDGRRRTVKVKEKRWLYSFEADAAAAAIRAGRQEFDPPGMTWDDTLGNLRVLDRWRADAGLVYDLERPERRPRTLRGTPLGRRSGAIPHRAVAGLGKATSVVALGFEDFPDFASASILLDAFFEKGGTIFDTAWIYGSGRSERILGEWLRSRGVRDEAVVIGKGAHSPLTYPDVTGRQLGESLERLGTDHVDVYFMHRDNPDVPVAEFVDALDAEVRAGRIRGPFGGSNWTRERFDAAVAWAGAHGRAARTALSNNFSLAEMVEPIWEGCVAASDKDWKAWLAARGVTNFAWSSQGRGFFFARGRGGRRGGRPGLGLEGQPRAARPGAGARGAARATADRRRARLLPGAAVPGGAADRTAAAGGARRQRRGARDHADARAGPLA